MWLWRVARRARWLNVNHTNPDHVSQAAKDLRLREGELGLSVFRVADDSEAEHVAKLFAMTCRDRPDNLDYLLIPEECMVALQQITLRPTPDDQLHPYLSERHFEIQGLTQELGIQLVQAIGSNTEFRVCRLSESDLLWAASLLVQQDASLAKFLADHWRSILKV